MLHLLVLLLLAPAALADCDGTVEIESSDADHWQARLLLVSDSDIEAWAVKITFDTEVDFIESAMAEVTGSGKSWTLRNKEWDGGMDAGTSSASDSLSSTRPRSSPSLLTSPSTTRSSSFPSPSFPGALPQGDLGLQRCLRGGGRGRRLLDRPCVDPWTSEWLDTCAWVLIFCRSPRECCCHCKRVRSLLGACQQGLGCGDT